MKTLFFLLVTCLLEAAHFAVLVPASNNEETYKRTLDSIFTQSYGNYRVIYIDDASKDLSPSLVQNYLVEKNLSEKVTFIHNEIPQGTLSNLYHAISKCDPKEVVVLLEGNDWLAHREVLSRLNEEYSNSDVWLTHSQFLYYPSYELGFGAEIPQHVTEEGAFRYADTKIAPLCTFYAGLFKQIHKKDLLREGTFIQKGYSYTMMTPLLELAGPHTRFIPEISYVSNVSTTLSDFITQSDLSNIQEKEKYQPASNYNAKAPTKRIYVTPGYWGQLFANDNPVFNRDDCLDPMIRLRAALEDKGYELIQADSLENLGEFEYLIVFEVFPHQLPVIETVPIEKRILFLWEPPSVLPDNYHPKYHQYFSKVFTWNDALVDNQKYFKFFYPVFRPQISEPIDFFNKRLSTLIACNKSSNYPQELYSERLRVIHFFEGFLEAEFDLFGRNWPSFRNYQGEIGSKVDTLKYYRFSYAYENVKDIPGYITEKIFDCFQAGSIPIYLGASNIEEYIPKSCYIDRNQFSSDRELYEYLNCMSVERYEEYQNSIREFLLSEAAKKYSIENFIKTFMSIFP